jgi:hypothetical protein
MDPRASSEPEKLSVLVRSERPRASAETLAYRAKGGVGGTCD